MVIWYIPVSRAVDQNSTSLFAAGGPLWNTLPASLYCLFKAHNFIKSVKHGNIFFVFDAAYKFSYTFT